MKIAFLNDVVYGYATGDRSATGGAERQQWLLARALATAGWEVTVGVRRGLAHHKVTSVDGVKFSGIGPAQVLFAWHRFLAAERPDWWYWRCASHLFGFGVALAKLSGARSIFAAGLDRDVKVREALYSRPRWWLAYALGLEAADRIVLQNGGQYSDLPHRWKPKAHIVPSIAVRAEALKPHAGRPRQVAWIAALREVKRPDRMVEIARRLPQVRFVVCGGPTTYMAPPGYGERMMELFQRTPNIEYRGQVSPEEAVQVVGESAILLSTSDEEGFPSTFLEAWTQGTPVVSLNIDPNQVINSAGVGVVCGGVERAVAEIADLAVNPARRDEMGQRAIQYVAAAHSGEVVVAALERAMGSASTTHESRGGRAMPVVH